MKKVYIPVGLPGSGKSTWIRNKRKDLTRSSVVISGDQIRLMLNMGEYRFLEEDTRRITGSMVDMAINFLEIYEVVFLDEYYLSNLADVRREVEQSLRLHALPLHGGIDVQFVPMKRNLGECIHRRCTDDREPDTSRWPNVLLELNESFEPLK